MCQFVEGQLVKVDSYRGETRNLVCRVVSVLDKRDTVAWPVRYESIRRRPHLQRSRFLLTVQDDKGLVRSFYDGFLTARPLSVWERVRRWVSRLFTY